MATNNIHVKHLSLGLILLLFNITSLIEAQITINLKDIDKKIAHLPPVEKAQIYIQCYEYFLNTDVTKAIVYNQKAFEISKANQLIVELAFCYYNFGYQDRIKANYPSAIENFTNSISLFEKSGNKIGLCQCYNNLGIIYKNKNETKLAMQHYTEALKIAEKIEYKNGIIDIITNIAIIYLKQEDYKKAIIYLEKALAMQKVRDNFVINNLGIAYDALEDYPKALKYFKESLEIAKEDENMLIQAASLGNIGTNYLKQKQYAKALTYYKKSMAIEEKLGLEKDLIDSYTNIGNIYRTQNEHDTALMYFEKAILLVESTSAQSALKKIYLNIALTHEATGNYKKAIDYLYLLNNLNKELFDVEKNKQIEELLAKFETESKEKELIILKKDKELKEIELAKNQAEIDKQKLFRELETKESKNKIILLNKQNELQAMSLQKNKIEKEKKEEEIISLTKEAELQQFIFEKEQAELRQRNLLKNIAIIVAGILILAAIILIILYQQKLKAVELLNLKTEEVNKQKIYELLRDQEFLAITASIEGQEKERKRIAQDLHDGIGGNLASIKLNLANIIEGTNDKKLMKVMKNIDDTYNEVRAISHNLLPSKLMNTAFISLINNFINEILGKKQIEVSFNAFPEQELNYIATEIKVEIYRIVQELMNNIVKYSKAKNVEVQVILRNGQVNLMVEDDGVGFDTNKLGSGIGLNNIQSRIHEMKGVVSIESSIGNWSLVNIEIPVENALLV